jgi:hypothetical protein
MISKKIIDSLKNALSNVNEGEYHEPSEAFFHTCCYRRSIYRVCFIKTTNGNTVYFLLTAINMRDNDVNSNLKSSLSS